jgi:hypothetical protein
MARITGSQTKAIYKNGLIATAFGTAVAGVAGDRIRASISPNLQAKELSRNPIGAGLLINDNVFVGRITPTIKLDMDLGYRNGADQISAQFFSTSTAPAEQTASQADYLHRFTMNPVANTMYGTLAYEMTDAKVAEFPSCAITGITTSFSEASEIVKFQADVLGNAFVSTSVINTNATIASATALDAECTIVNFEDRFWINASSAGALSASFPLSIMSYTRTLMRPQKISGLIKGSTGNPAPLVDEVATGTLSVTLEALPDLTYFDAWTAETQYKCRMNIEGTQIGSGVNKAWNEYTPYMKMIQAPIYNLTDSGFNSVTLNFVILQGATTPTGMNSALPYLEIINGRSTNYIA